MNLSSDAYRAGKLVVAGRIVFCAAAVIWFWLSRELFFYDQTLYPALFVTIFGAVFWARFGADQDTAVVRRRTTALFLVSNLAFLYLWQFPLTPRQQFFHDVDSVRPGMTITETEARMTRYRPVLPSRFNGRTGPSARPVETPFSGSLNYVRSNENGDYAAYKDFAIVTFENNRVVSVMVVGD